MHARDFLESLQDEATSCNTELVFSVDYVCEDSYRREFESKFILYCIGKEISKIHLLWTHDKILSVAEIENLLKLFHEAMVDTVIFDIKVRQPHSTFENILLAARKFKKEHDDLDLESNHNKLRIELAKLYSPSQPVSAPQNNFSNDSDDNDSDDEVAEINQNNIFSPRPQKILKPLLKFRLTSSFSLPSKSRSSPNKPPSQPHSQSPLMRSHSPQQVDDEPNPTHRYKSM